MRMCINAMYVQVRGESRKERQNPWSWRSYGGCEHLTRRLGLHSDLLQEQQQSLIR